MERDTVGSVRNGKAFEARIHKIDDSGNGIIETTSSTDIILGPVDQDAVGDRIEAMKLPGPYARIKRPKKILPSNYINEVQKLFSYDFSIDYGDAYGNIGKRGLEHEDGYGILEYIPPWKSGELHDTTIVRRSNAGNGIVSIDNRSVNIGPVRQGVIGADVSVILIEPAVGVCKTISVRAEDYFADHIRKIDRELVDTEDYFELGMRVRDRESDDPENAVIVNLPPIPAKDYIAYHNGETDVAVSEDNPQYDQYASVVVVILEKTLSEEYLDYMGEEPIPLQILSNDNIDHYAFPPERLEIIGDHFSNTDKGLELLESKADSQADSLTSTYSKHSESTDGLDSKKSKEVLADDDSPHKYQTNSVIDPATDSNDQNTSTDTKQTKDDNSNLHDSSDIVDENKVSTESQEQQDCNENQQSTSTDLNELRKKAQDSANGTVSKDATTTTPQPQYSRSSAIREYVMARADGRCEGCGEPSPFTSKTGEPYLHAHHIHELSDGGSDTPHTVIGLCPNCHYRIHHGQDGDKYNQKLLRKVKSIEENNDNQK